jgi:lipopolysaccharide export system permease protein
MHERGHGKEDTCTGTLKRYIFTRASYMCIAALGSLSVLVIASVFMSKIGLFTEHGTRAGVIFRFMFFSSPQIVYWVMPFSVCVGIVTTQALFSRHMETIAMQACSVSFRRICTPYIMVGALASVIMAALSFELYPLAERQAQKIEEVSIKKVGVEGSFTVNGGRFKIGGDIYLVKYIDVVKGIMKDVRCYSMENGRIVTIRRAPDVLWDGRAWISGRMETLTLTADDIVSTKGTAALPLTHRPRDLTVAQPAAEVLTLGELLEYRSSLAKESIRSVNLDTQIHNRISFAAAPLIMTLLVLPFGMRFARVGGIARGTTMGIFMGLLYWSVHSAMTGAGMAGYVHPALAAWSADLAALCASAVMTKFRRVTYG